MCAENSELRGEDEHLDIPKLKCPLLKRPVDLPPDDREGRKKIALTALRLSDVDLAMALELDSEVEPNIEETIESTTTEKGKAKAKASKRKTRQSACAATGRVHTRADSKKK